MAEMILPGTFIEVRPEGLITPGRVTVGNIGIVGTASKGPIGQHVILGGYTEARQRFGDYDKWIDGKSDELTLVRALEIAYNHGATTVFAVRVAGKKLNGATAAEKAAYKLKAGTADVVTLTAKTEGTWANELSINVADAEEHASVEDEPVPTSGTDALKLKRIKVVKSTRNRIRHFVDQTGVTRSLLILYTNDEVLPGADPAKPEANQVTVNRETGAMTFKVPPAAADKITASYVVDKASAVKVTLRLGRTDEAYTIVDGNDLASDINSLSAFVDAKVETNAGGLLPSKSDPAGGFAAFKGGVNGASDANYKDGLDVLLNQPAHIIVAAGQDDSFGDELDAHCQQASTDAIKRDRIAVVGSKFEKNREAMIDGLRGHKLDSDRVVFVGPGIKVTDAATTPLVEVMLPGAYAAAAIAGLLSSFSAHISLTNKPIRVGDLEYRFTPAELTQFVQNRVLALEERQGLRTVKGITTSTNNAWHQITTRRIVDFAKFGVRSAASSYIGLLNNERVRGAMRATINSFLTEMVQDEMLVSYELEVTATRDEERKGIARVTMTLRPTFSIDFIKVTMFLE